MAELIFGLSSVQLLSQCLFPSIVGRLLDR
jgi:hypothetical protein